MEGVRMPKRCARCDSFAGRGRELALPGDWVSYLQAEHDVPEPVGRLSMPLCTDCFAEFESARGDAEPPADLLDAITPDRLIDEGN